MKKYIALFLAIGLGAGLNPAWAQTMISASGAPIAMQVGQGTLITLPRPADTIFVANPAIADVEVKTPQLIFLYGKEAGDTSIYAVDGDHKLILSRPVAVSRDIAGLQQTLDEVFPGRGLKAAGINQTVLITGEVESPTEADEAKRLAGSFVTSDAQLIDRISVSAPNQINLRVRIAEVSHTVVKDLGLNWDTVLHPGQFVFGLASGSQVLSTSPYSTSASALTSAIATRNTIAAGATNSLVAGINSGSTLIDSVIDALDQNGLINTLAEPNLTTTSGETASFLAGGEFPILVPGSTALGSATVEFKDYGVSLAFTPVILEDGRISLRVAPEVSQLSTQGEVEISGTTIPALTTRRAMTTVELASGQTFAIGGLLENSVTNTVNAFPGLANLPVLGPLFRSTDFQHDQTELVILVTPYIVRPSSGAMSAPTDGYVPPTDSELFLQGKDTHATTAAALAVPTSPSGGKLIGSAGFVLN